MELSFGGSNEEFEIETLDEFFQKIGGTPASKVKLDGWVMTQIDFSSPSCSGKSITKSDWKQYDFNGAQFWGCTMPSFATICELQRRGATVVNNPPEGTVPFVTFRAFMYNQREMQATDKAIFEYTKTTQSANFQHMLLQTLHDHFVQDALLDYLENKTVVAIMGGHGMQRGDESYRNVVYLGWKLARAGFIVSTGGGPGAMEAANLGAYLFEKTKEEVDDALHIVSTVGADKKWNHEFENFEAPKAVLSKYGEPEYGPSLGVPTWRFGHEPPNMFATFHAKLFSNALREDGLLAIGNGGIIYFPGSAGTRQEVFQAACRNQYAQPGGEVPMVFFDTKFWTDCGVYNVLKQNSQDQPFTQWLELTDEIDDIINVVVKFRKERNLPTVPLEELKCRYWEKGITNPDNKKSRTERVAACMNKKRMHVD